MAELKTLEGQSLPHGSVTFLLTDIEASTAAWEANQSAMADAVQRHEIIAQDVIEKFGGRLLKRRGEGDSLFSVFQNAADAISAAASLQSALVTERWSDPLDLRVRAALHTGNAEIRDADYFGPVVNRCARLRGIGHGGQILVSEATAALAADSLPSGTELQNLGLQRLRDLSRPEKVYQLCAPGLPVSFPALRSLAQRPNNLPVQITSFLGRDREMDEIVQASHDASLLTLTGAGGSGKTRLALQASVELVDYYPDGVMLVELAAVADSDRVPNAICTVLGVKEAAAAPIEDALVAHCLPRRLLILLDNCEHLLEGCARTVHRLVHTCPHLHILATSREPLGVLGEVEYPVLPLQTPDPTSLPTLAELQTFPAVQLFIERARSVRPGFSLSDINAAPVASICHRLDGLPFAIELAAASVRSLSPKQMEERLLRLIKSPSSTVEDRHRTLEALIDWSYQRLAAVSDERMLLQAMLRRLSVFAGGWTLEAAEAISGGLGIEPDAVFGIQERLIRASLVVVETHSEANRYRLLETVRAFAMQRLNEMGEDNEAQDRHLQYYLELAIYSQTQLIGGEPGPWLDRLEIEHENFRAALRNAVDVQMRLQLAGALWRFWLMRSYLAEGVAWIEGALSRTYGVENAARARALTGLGVLRLLQSDRASSVEALEEGLSIFRKLEDQRGTAEALNCLGTVLKGGGEYIKAAACFDKCMVYYEAAGDQRGMAACLSNRGLLALDLADKNHAADCFRRSLDIYILMHDEANIANVSFNLGLLWYQEKRYPDARSLFERSLQCYSDLRNRWAVAITSHNIGLVVQATVSAQNAEPFFLESVKIFADLNSVGDMVQPICSLADVARDTSDMLRAARLFGAASALREKANVALAADAELQLKRDIQPVLESLGQAAFAKEWDRGAATNLTDLLEYILTGRLVDNRNTDVL